MYYGHGFLLPIFFKKNIGDAKQLVRSVAALERERFNNFVTTVIKKLQCVGVSKICDVICLSFCNT